MGPARKLNTDIRGAAYKRGAFFMPFGELVEARRRYPRMPLILFASALTCSASPTVAAAYRPLTAPASSR